MGFDIDSVRIELNDEIPSWCHRDLLGVEKSLVTRSVRSEASCVSSKGDTKERYKRTELCFSTQKEES